MGQVISSNEMRKVVDANIKSFITQATSSYARLLNKSPTFVTYYSQDAITSTADVNLGGAIQLIGPESPIRFSKILDFPLYGLPEIDASSSWEELQGVISAGVRGEALVLPGTISPLENDFFVIPFLNTPLVFRNINCNPDRVEGKAFFKFEYILDPADVTALDAQTSKNYTFELATIGTEQNPILLQDVSVLLYEMENIIERLKSSYWSAFYERSSSTLILHDGWDKPVHDRAVDIFINNNNLLNGTGYMKSRYILPVDYFDKNFFLDFVYPRTIYSIAERGIWDHTNINSHVIFAPNNPTVASNPFFTNYALSGYYEASITDNLDGYAIGGSEFISDVTNQNYISGTALSRLSKMCLNENAFPADQVEALRIFNSLINNNFLISDRIEQFWLMPLIFMRAKRFTDVARLNN
jgi:hypothetical protein